MQTVLQFCATKPAAEPERCPLGLLDLPPEVMHHIESFLTYQTLPPARSMLVHPWRSHGSMSSVLRPLSNVSQALYRLFSSTRFAHLGLWGNEKTLAYVKYLLSNKRVFPHIQEIVIHSICPLHHSLWTAIAKLIRNLPNLRTITYHAQHPLPRTLARAIAIKASEPTFESLHITATALQSIEELERACGGKESSMALGLRNLTLRQDGCSLGSMEILTAALFGIPGSSPPWLEDTSSKKWKARESLLLRAISRFLARSAATLETFQLDVETWSEATDMEGKNNSLRTMLSSCNVSLLVEPLTFPHLRRLALPPTPFADSSFLYLISTSPLLEHLDITNRGLPDVVITFGGAPPPPSPSSDALVGPLPPISAQSLQRLETLVLRDQENVVSTLDPRWLQIIESAHGGSLKSLSLSNVGSVTEPRLRKIAEAQPQLEMLKIYARSWDVDMDTMRSSLMPLVNLEDFSFSFPPNRTDPPEEVPDVHFAMHHDEQSASEIIDEIYAFFYEPDTDDEDSEDDDGHSSVEEPLELSESDREKKQEKYADLNVGDPVGIAASIEMTETADDQKRTGKLIVESDSENYSSSSFSSSDSTSDDESDSDDSGSCSGPDVHSNANLRHFNGIAEGWFKAHPRLKCMLWDWELQLAVSWHAHRYYRANDDGDEPVVFVCEILCIDELEALADEEELETPPPELDLEEANAAAVAYALASFAPSTTAENGQQQATTSTSTTYGGALSAAASTGGASGLLGAALGGLFGGGGGEQQN